MEIVEYLGFIGFLEILRFILDSWDLFGIHYFGFIDIIWTHFEFADFMDL